MASRARDWWKMRVSERRLRNCSDASAYLRMPRITGYNPEQQQRQLSMQHTPIWYVNPVLLDLTTNLCKRKSCSQEPLGSSGLMSSITLQTHHPSHQRRQVDPVHGARIPLVRPRHALSADDVRSSSSTPCTVWMKLDESNAVGKSYIPATGDGFSYEHAADVI
ncbi:hypothetical protein FE257_008511 [Aspergillus nanangensis]|uniref:Uncharacterized protein n=1 Tax=Aspergillus nanangensis TaxID=2582783 RepID=A0AAD4CL71_ASPNN|nr:hypothetical protein FE257_008511 [Aspergillus nanangensis]